MSDCLINLLKEVGKCIWPLVKPHFDYWWCFDGNVQGLRNEIGRLEGEWRNMDQKIEEARLRAEIATTAVKDWSTEGTQKLEEARKILQGCVDINKWNIFRRYCVGKNTKKTAEGIANFRNEGNSIVIAVPAPPAAMVAISHAPTFEFQSRKRIEEDIMEYLKDGNIRMIAICGAGGVGKTTMARRIEDMVREEKLFDEVVTVVVSQQTDDLKIQKKIAEKLGLDLSGDTLDINAYKLHTRLMDPKKKLIIFDDVWKRFKLEDIGVPYGYGECKIILTSRQKDVCKEMKANKVIEIQVLEEEEAWTLFREQCGDCVDDDVAAECKGLPIALVTVGTALKEKNINTWKDALYQMRKANPIDFPEFLENVYRPLKLSYDFLENEREKSLFLLCCLFPEDYNISIEELALLSFGLGMFAEIDNIEDGRNRTHNLLERLRSRFLLMPGFTEEYVKMHDVVRDVAIYIGSKDKEGFLKSLQVPSKDSSIKCNWMSVDISNSKFSIELDFRNLRLLMILNSNYFEFPEGFDVNDICFEGMEELRVLYFSGQNFQSLPSSLKFLKELRKLHLDNCKVKDISFVGELTGLKILRILMCDNIEELPAHFRQLTSLRLLELWYCYRLKRIVAGVISSLVGLEELKIVRCSNKWEAKGNVSEERNASLSELESLRNLTSLEIDIFDPNLVAQEILLSEDLRRYQISCANRFLFSDRKIRLDSDRDATFGNWIKRLVKNTRSITLDGNGSYNFNLGEIESLRELVFKNCSTVEKLGNAVDCKFPMLEQLELRKLRELEEIIDGTIRERSNSFQKLESINIRECPKLGYLWQSPNQNVYLGNLKSIDIRDCPNLLYLFSMATARSLVQLESLEIHDCEKMEQVLWNEMESSNTEEEEASIIIEFPKLKTLLLHNLPNLLGFTQLGVEIIKFPQSIYLKILHCPKLRTKINEYPACMNTIEELDFSSCDIIEEIFREDGNRHIIFQELRELTLMNLPCLTTFHRGTVESIKFPKLKELWINNLPMLNSFVEIEDSEADTHDHHSLHFFCNKKVEFIGLETLYLKNLPDKISKIWCCHIPISFFHDLESLEIYKVDGIKNLISSSIAIALVNLKELKIECCQEMIGVIEEETNVRVNSAFQNLRCLFLRCLFSTATARSPVLNVYLGNLKSIDICDCPNLRYLFSMATARSLVQLQSLEIRICEKMEQVLWNEMESSNTEEEASIIIVFPKLNTLLLNELPNLLGFTTQLGVEIIINNYPTRMIMIKDLVFRRCDHIEEIFRDDGNRHITFQELYKLELIDLPCLTTFYKGAESIKFPKLKELWIGNLPRLNSFVEIEDPEHTHDLHSLHFFCNKKVKIIGLETLYLKNLPDKISKIWCRHIPISFFHDLERLEIYEVDGIKNLISSSIAIALVNLKELKIECCQEIIDVIEEETHVCVNPVFPKLESLKITHNCKLRSFCQWKLAFELPSLYDVRIVDCPLMKTFTLGSLSTPKLYRFSINYKEIFEMEDLNVGIHQFISTEIADEDEDEIEG